MVKISALWYDKNSVGFLFWGIVGILIAIFSYSPFEQPFLSDKAYLHYMSQVVFRGDPLYRSTTFGYTPLSIVLVGLVMKIGSLFSLSTIVSARIFGLIVYGITCGMLFLLLKKVFFERVAVWIGMLLFIGIGYLQIVSGINAEPKLFVLVLSIAGVYFLIKDNWLIAGCCFSAGAMCWHVSVISLMACVILLPWRSNRLGTVFLNLSLGVVLGVIPVLVYLGLTDGWLDFWDQAIVRKLAVEGKDLGESPFRWLYWSFFPLFVTEVGHFIMAFIGLVSFVGFSVYSRERCLRIIRNVNTVYVLVVFCLVWCLFNTFEFQGPPDIIPLLFVFVLFCTFLIMLVKPFIKRRLLRGVMIAGFLFYNFYDAFVYRVPFTYKEQVALMREIHKKYGDPFVFGFEEYFTVLEKSMPTKYMRFAPYEDYFLGDDRVCKDLINQIDNGRYHYIITKGDKKVVVSDYPLSSSIAGLFRLPPGTKQVTKLGQCGSQILRSVTSQHEVGSFEVNDPILTLHDLLSYQVQYQVFRIEKDQIK